MSSFTYEHLHLQYTNALERGYRILTCRDYCKEKSALAGTKIVVNRIDIDFSIKKAERLGIMFNELGIKGSFFVRLHAHEYNPFAFENYRILTYLRDTGHELGYHSEIMDQAAIWNQPPEVCLKRDIDVMERMLSIKVFGAASHGGMTGINNLEFWHTRRPSDFGLLYEAYDAEPDFNLFNTSLYISDSEWTRWKCYLNGRLQEGNRKSFGEHVSDDPPVVYLLIHSDSYHVSHFYE